MHDADELRRLALWYREFAERAGNPVIWESRLHMAEDLEGEAARLEAGEADPTGVAAVPARSGPPVPVPEVEARTQAALRRNPGLDATAITVQAEAGTVILAGTVHTLFERKLAEREARTVPGVTAVQDWLLVDPGVE